MLIIKLRIKCLMRESIQFKLLKNGKLSNEFNIDIPGKHNILNSLLAIACGRELGMSYEEMLKDFKKLEVTSMRLDIVKGKNLQ